MAQESEWMEGPLRSKFMEAISHPKEIDANSYQLY